MPVLSILTLATYSGYLAFGAWSLHNEGTAAIHHWPAGGSAAGKSLQNGRLLYAARTHVYHTLFSLDTQNPRAESKQVALIGKGKRYGPPRYEAYFQDNRILLLSDYQYDLYEIADGQVKQVVGPVHLPEHGHIQAVRELPGARLAVFLMIQDRTKKPSNPRSSWVVIDMNRGDLLDAANETLPDNPGFEFEIGSRCYRLEFPAMGLSSAAYKLIIEDATSADGAQPVGEIRIDNPYASPQVVVDQSQVAVYSHPLPDGARGELHLYDMTNLSEIKEVRIEIPRRLMVLSGIPQLALEAINIASPPDSRRGRARLPYITLGGGYLCLEYMQRVAVWDVHQTRQPRFLGIAPTPQPWESGIMTDFHSWHSRVELWRGATTPIERRDGALGFVLRDGLLWLELPERMRERAR